MTANSIVRKIIAVTLPMLLTVVCPVPASARAGFTPTRCDFNFAKRANQRQSSVARDIIVPQATLRPGKTIAEIARNLDEYFSDLILAYPPATQEILNQLYFSGIGLEVAPSIARGRQASWGVNGDVDRVDSYKISIDTDIHKTEILRRWNMIHEIAVHVGQFHSRAEQIGVDAVLNELQEFRVVTEISAALIELEIMRIVPLDLLLEDLHRRVAGTEIGRITVEILEREYKRRYQATADAYLGLSHRDEGGTELLQQTLTIMINRPQFAACLARGNCRITEVLPRENCGRVGGGR